MECKYYRAMRLVEAVANNLQGAQGEEDVQPAQANAAP